MDSASALLSFLAGVTVRSLALAAVPLVLVAAWRVKSAATRHAALFVVTAGMLAMTVLYRALPAIPLPILHRATASARLSTPPIPAVRIEAIPAFAAPRAAADVPAWPRVLAAVYLAGLIFCLVRLLFGALFTRRLLRGASHIESELGSQVYESTWISVPLTVGWLRPRILLPAGWREWDPAKLNAVLVHERNHIRRGDWAIALGAAVNRSLYWFNPLAWWLERRLATLAEQACDDAALLALGQRESYAQALLDMAAAVKTGQGRLVWDAMAMAKGAEVRIRIERILDESRQIPRGLTRSRWLMLMACSLPLIYFTAALRPVPAAAQQQEQGPPPAIAEMLHYRPNLTAAQAAQMEQSLLTNPGDLQARTRLILYYFSTPQRETRLAHIYWLIGNHPESAEAAITSQGITAKATSFNTTADYERASALWRQQAASHPNDDAVLMHAAMFFSEPGADPDEAERLLLQIRALHPNTGAGVARLATLYAAAILGTTGDPGFPSDHPNFGNRVRAEIENNPDGRLLQMTGSQLAAGTRNLNEHPLLQPVRELSSRLLAQGAKLLGPQASPANASAAAADLQRARAELLAATSGMPAMLAQDAPSGHTVEELFPGMAVLSPAPTPLSTVEPEYPPLARQARIQGVVDLAVAIGPDGHPTNIRALRGHPLMVQAAIQAVRQYVYPPVGQASAFEERVNFTLPASSTGMATQGNRVFFFGPANAEPSPAAPGTVRVGPRIQAAMLTTRVDPVYPPLARQARIQGTVTLNVVVNKDGTVESVSVAQGHPLLVQAAIDAVKQWVYKATAMNGEPIAVSTTVEVPFELQH